MTNRNPVLAPEVCIPDGEAHVMPDGRLYVYGSWDQYDDVFCSSAYRVVSTDDMAEWTVHDTSFAVSEIPWSPAEREMATTRSIGRWSMFRQLVRLGGNVRRAGLIRQFHRMGRAGRDHTTPSLFAPDAIAKDGRYYLFFDLSDSSEGVAVADRPEGPFHEPVRLPATGIDPAVFIDDDGTAYYYWGQFRASGVRMHDDLRGFDAADVRHDLVTAHEHHFHEGSSMRKIGDTYYYVFADDSRGKPTSLGYATGPTPLGPFTYRGVIIDNDGCDPGSWNNHGSIERFGDQWYVFYHRSSGNSGARRRLCVEPILIGEDGTIAEVPMTSQGTGEPFAPGERIDGWRACHVRDGGYVGAVDGQETLVLPQGGAGGTYRYLYSNEPITRAALTIRGTGSIVLRIGEHATRTQAVSGVVSVDLGSIAPGTHEIEIELAAGANVALDALTLW